MIMFRICMHFVLLFATCTLAQSPPPTSTANPLAPVLPLPYPNATLPLHVCTSNLRPMTMCRPGMNSTDFTGFDIELFRQAASELNYEEGIDYVFICMPFGEIITSLATPNDTSTCAMAISAITVNSQREADGIKFSFPYFNENLAVMVPTTVASSNGWGWVSPFTTGLWIITICTAIVFAVSVFIIEFYSLKRRLLRRHRGCRSAQQMRLLEDLHSTSVNTAYTLLGLDFLHVRSLGARVASLAFAFMSLILVNTYTANLAASLTIHSINTQITSVAQLRGKLVYTLPIYTQRIRSEYGIQAQSLTEFEGEESIANVSKLIIGGEITALIADAAIVLGYLNSYPGCDIGLLPNRLLDFQYAVAFPNSTTDEYVNLWSDALLQMMDTGVVTRLKQTFMPDVNYGCGTGDLSKYSQSASFHQLWGLWVILGAGVAVGVVFMVGVRWWRGRKNPEWRGWKSPLEEFDHYESDGSSCDSGSEHVGVGGGRVKEEGEDVDAVVGVGVGVGVAVEDVDVEGGTGGARAMTRMTTTNTVNGRTYTTKTTNSAVYHN